MIISRLQTALAEPAPENCDDLPCSASRKMMNNDRYRFQYYFGLPAMKYDIELPERLSQEALAEFDRIQNLPSDDFDRELIELKSRIHREDIERVERL